MAAAMQIVSIMYTIIMPISRQLVTFNSSDGVICIGIKECIWPNKSSATGAI